MGGLLVLADGTAEADAERAVKVASKAAEAAVSKAVQAAAAAGLEYRPPPDMQLDTPRVPKVTSPYTEDSGYTQLLMFSKDIKHVNTCWFCLRFPVLCLFVSQHLCLQFLHICSCYMHVRFVPSARQAGLNASINDQSLLGMSCWTGARHVLLKNTVQMQVDARQLERKAQAAQQLMTRRAQRLEKAQAAATQAHLAAVERQSSLQREHNNQPARASLQQV